ncbi:CAAX farnesyltransferase (FTase) subunit beta [Coemansia sp. RSA 1646]|nr:CAAX farnesyltransferase (FTase) subunit beta [Coemansia sp. RSA 1646]KAJ1771421.1 CAAX farnesyltransferase (FTase) subunit beta [Coemansia sp. RSA 1843]KAJ2089183.1 CAAX farnesyltransferase (FTase) subunit beta [Coemansia sp. RSA 986]
MSFLFSYDFRYDDNEHETETSETQTEVEDRIGRIYMRLVDPQTLPLGGDIDDSKHKLLRAKHEQFVHDSIHGLSSGFTVLDSSRPWIPFWCLNSLDIMGCDIDDRLRLHTVDTFRKMHCPSGGFRSDPWQLPHIVSSYAAVMSLVLVGGEEAYDVVDRHAMYRWLMQMKQQDGSFAVHDGGEVDVRGIYCALVIGSVLNIMTSDLVRGCAEFIARCQTFEGGIGPYPGVEAHGGYTLCGMAALEILGKSDVLDLGRLAKWMCARQMAFEGGFNGRTNKLVDGCYSYWVGGAFPLLQKALKRSLKDDYLYERPALQRYILACCQDTRLGGLRDKPGKHPDLYHTMYCLLGLSLSQHYIGVDPDKEFSDTSSVFSVPVRMMQWGAMSAGTKVIGVRTNIVRPVHPVYGTSFAPLAQCIKYFYSLPPLAESLADE